MQTIKTSSDSHVVIGILLWIRYRHCDNWGRGCCSRQFNTPQKIKLADSNNQKKWDYIYGRWNYEAFGSLKMKFDNRNKTYKNPSLYIKWYLQNMCTRGSRFATADLSAWPQHNATKRELGPRLNIKTIFQGMGIPMLKIRRLWDRLIFKLESLYW